MIPRRTILSGLAAMTAAGCTPRQPVSTAMTYPIAPPPPDRATMGLDAVIDLSRSVTVADFRAVRRSGILGVIHKATEGGDYLDTAYAGRWPQAEAAGLLWGAYHFGTGQTSGARQAAYFLSVARPGPRTLLALDLEANENNPGNSMRLDQAEEFVQAVAAATGRLPIVYVHPTWANGDPLPNSGLSLGARITPDSPVARCGLWIADYHDSPEVPIGWETTGWRLWQYAGDESVAKPAYGQTNIVQGVSHCDRNLFNGDAGELQSFWGAG
ncbi:MAG: 1,4-beta-N-acetylmuramidase [Reyranella sp.]|uniref:glycoside hydrolase family 25 protein n=1 Tax=Reyranella sp. TaxID=1929291 RepID=UPI0011F51A41|nr:glycoside hydrolase family 25 protein [Reyranella sp.]TAJ87236.1 MAG: 1,4-beta-N-acetylmuramidase [Reyranella sp.]TBR29523.1 MAG: 1,4-beta-N-acetylmuramidase [Reyranella sp.]